MACSDVSVAAVTVAFLGGALEEGYLTEAVATVEHCAVPPIPRHVVGAVGNRVVVVAGLTLSDDRCSGAHGYRDCRSGDPFEGRYRQDAEDPRRSAAAR